MTLVDVKELSRTLAVSPRHVWRLDVAEKLPRPVRIGNSVRWNLEDIQKWVSLGCPSRDEFDASLSSARI